MDDKNYSISVIRLIAMLMIIFCHILQGLNNTWAFWVNIGVQIFFFVSGFLYGKKEIKSKRDFYKKRIVKILTPYLIGLTVGLFLDVFLLKDTLSVKSIVGCYLGLGAFANNMPILSHTWFVSYILLCYMIVPVLQVVFSQNKFVNNFLLFLLFICIIQLFQIYHVINIEACWINNFIFGYFYGKCCNEQKEERIFNSFVILSSIIMVPLAIIYQENIAIKLLAFLNNYSNIIMNYGHVLLGTVIFIILYKILNHLKIENNALLKFSDKYSYYIYLVHQIFILYSFSVLFLTKYLWFNIILIFIFSIISAVILKLLSDLLIKAANKYLFATESN